MGVALGHGFTLAVADAGDVVSFGFSRAGGLGHGSLESVMLPGGSKPWRKMGGGSSPWPPAAATPSR